MGQGIGEIHVESDEELDVLIRLAGVKRVAARFNPRATGWGAMRMGGQPAQFGFDEECLEEVIEEILSRPGLQFRGVHMFVGTQILGHGSTRGQRDGRAAGHGRSGRRARHSLLFR